MAVAQSENVGVAFAMVLGAGAATALGAAVVFFPSLVKFANRKTLAGGLGISSGVMIYVSMIEIFQKSSLSFLDAGREENVAYVYATVCFFGGVVFMMLLNAGVTALLGGHHHHDHDVKPHSTQNVSNTNDEDEIEYDDRTSSKASADEAKSEEAKSEVKERNQAPGCPCHSDDPGGLMQEYHDMAEEIVEFEHQENKEWEGQHHDNDQEEEDEQGGAKSHGSDEGKLMRMSINTALAIALHNFPEGLATFVAALEDPAVGAVLAIAIAIHNVPEGLCVAMPIYYATGNRCKAFIWGCLSGVSEPVAALLGWIILANTFSDTLYAALFGMVGGMMVIISVRELLPTAHRYDPEDHVVTYAFIVGTAIMALSLVLFVL